jgi:ABC-2 type transport system ATP-binding protein
MCAGVSPPREVVVIDHLTKAYGPVVALDEVSFSVRAGEILGLIGPNGAGKTTLFECLAGLLPADGGRVIVGRGAPGARRSDTLFYVPDAIAPWPDQTVDWALRFTVGFLGGDGARQPGIVERLSLEQLLRSQIGALSKGQRKRVLLAIGLLTRQPVLVIDEPFEGLDLRQSRQAEAALRWHAASGRTLFVSIHQIHDAGRICDRFVLLSGGRVCAEGTAAELSARAAEKQGGGSPPEDFEEVFLALA